MVTRHEIMLRGRANALLLLLKSAICRDNLRWRACAVTCVTRCSFGSEKLNQAHPALLVPAVALF